MVDHVPTTSDIRDGYARWAINDEQAIRDGDEFDAWYKAARDDARRQAKIEVLQSVERDLELVVKGEVTAASFRGSMGLAIRLLEADQESSDSGAS